MNKLYEVSLITETLHGTALIDAQKKLSERVGLSQKQLQKIFAHPSYVVLRTAKRELADKTMQMIQNSGFQTNLHIVIPSSNLTPPEKHNPPSRVTTTHAAEESNTPFFNRLLRREAAPFTAVVLVLLLSIGYLLSPPSNTSLDHAADHALDQILQSGQSLSPDLYMRSARSEIRACFRQHVPSWKENHFKLFVEALNTTPPFNRKQQARFQPVTLAIQAARECPESFRLAATNSSPSAYTQ